MGNSEWDKHLRDMLGDFKSDGDEPHWDEFSRQLDFGKTPPEDVPSSQDESLKETLSNYKAGSEIVGWERIEASLNAADREFDEKVRKRIKQYEPQYDPLSWPVFLKRLNDSNQLRTNLIALKVIEFAAILFLLLTVVNMGRLGKLPFETPMFENQEINNTPTTAKATVDMAIDDTPQSKNADVATVPSHEDRISTFSRQDARSTRKITPSFYAASARMASKSFKSADISEKTSSSDSYAFSKNILPENNAIVQKTESIFSESDHKADNQLPTSNVDPYYSTDVNSDASPSYPALNESYITNALALLNSDLVSSDAAIIPHPSYVHVLKRKFLEFGILSQADYNRLRMPEDRLYSAGKQIIFPQQGIPSHGYGAGFTIAVAHPLWALETGIIYSAKNFKPGRELIVGGAFDNGSVEFQAMRLQLVTVPFQFRYRFEPKGRLKAYTLAGFGLNVITQSDIDVLIKYHFASLSANENPNNNPSLAETIRETRRIREHIRDGAPFSTKSFVSATAGLGLEYALTEHKTLFLQTALQYQIPNLSFSNINGKHIRSVSLQMGVRTPLGS